MFRIGFGYDAHRMVKGRRLVLGGVEIEYSMGLLGHSDADVLLHAVCDALLGAAGLGDLGRHFPDSDAKYKDAAGTELLASVAKMMDKAGYKVGNLDAILVAEKPRIFPYRERMERRIAEILGIDPGQVNVKATTTEKMGYTGRGEGMAAQCVALIIKRCNCKK